MKILNIKNSAFILSFTILSFVFSFSYAKSFKDVLDSFFVSLLSPLVPMIISLAVLYFIWGVIKFIKSDGKDKEEGKQLIFWGIVGLFVMLSVWGLVNVVKETLNL